VHREGFVGEVDEVEELIEVETLSVIDIRSIEQQKTGAPHPHSRSSRDPELNRQVTQIHVLVRARTLDFNEIPLIAPHPFEDIDAGQDVFVNKGGFEDCGQCRVGNCVFRLFEGEGSLVVLSLDRSPAGVALLSQQTHLCPAIKDELQRLVDGGGAVALEAVVPQPQGALGSRLNARFRQAAKTARHRAGLLVAVHNTTATRVAIAIALCSSKLSCCPATSVSTTHPCPGAPLHW